MDDRHPYWLGVTVMDHQHARLLTLLEQLDSPTSDLAALLAGFCDYAERHFLVEEELMEAHGFPGRVAHRAEHELFRRSFEGLKAEALGGSAVLRRAMTRYVRSWLDQHINTVDRELADFLRGEALLAA